MTEGVRADVLVDSGPVNGFAQDRKDHHTGKLRPAIVEEHDVRCGHFSRPVVEVTLNLSRAAPLTGTRRCLSPLPVTRI